MIQRASACVRVGASFEAAPRRLGTRGAGGKRFQANAVLWRDFLRRINILDAPEAGGRVRCSFTLQRRVARRRTLCGSPTASAARNHEPSRQRSPKSGALIGRQHSRR
jgi:hypothetical protein